MNQIERTILVDLLHNPSSTVHQVIHRNRGHSFKTIENTIRALTGRDLVMSRTSAGFLTISEHGYRKLTGGRR